jgi:hypothetical protein
LAGIIKDVDMTVDKYVDNLHDSLFEGDPDQIAQNMGSDNLINFNQIRDRA